MRGLLIKDFSVLLRQMRAFILLVFVFSVIPSTNMNTFAVVYAAMLPYTALAYDERSHWDQLAAMLPYSVRDLVLSKYVLGWLLITGTALLTLVIGAAERAFGLAGCLPETALLSLAVGVILMALILPPMFRFGVEKGRMLFLFLAVGTATVSASLLGGIAAFDADAAVLRMLRLLLPVLAMLLSVLSVLLSIRFYARRSR